MSPGREALERISRPVAEEAALLDQGFRRHLGCDLPLIQGVFSHLLEGGGKRVRPLLALLCSGLLAESGSRRLPPRESVQRLAAAVEYIHIASLLHDDVVDRSDLRRGKRTAHRVWGAESAILSGDYLYARAYSLLVENGELSLLAVISAATTHMAQGEVLQLLRSFSTGTTEEEYLEVIEGKTACLISACSEGAACLAETEREERAALRDYGHHLGLAFQIADDLLDYTGSPQTLGKPAGLDFSEGKVTLPVIHLFAALPEPERAALREVFLRDESRPGEFPLVLEQMKATGSLTRTQRTAEEHAARARVALSPFPPGPCRESLLFLADYVVGRES